MRRPFWIGLLMSGISILSTVTLAQPSITSHVPMWTSPTLEQVQAALEGLDFESFVDVAYEQYLLRFPQVLTHYGLASPLGVRNDRLDDYSEEYLAETRAIESLIADRLASFDRSALTPDQQLTYDICAWYWDDLVRAHPFADLDYLVTDYYITSRDWSLYDLLAVVHPFSRRGDVEDYVARLRQVSSQLDQLVSALTARAEKGVVAPEITLAQAAVNLRGLVYASPYAHPFYTTLSENTRSIPGLSSSERTALLDEVAELVRTDILPAYRRLYDRLVSLRSVAPQSIGYSAQPNGEAYYAYALRHQTQTELSPTEIHQLGLEQVERLRDEIQQAAVEMGYADGLAITDIYARASVDGGTISGANLILTYEQILDQAKKDARDVFAMLPQADVVVVPDPIGGYYRASNGSRPAEFAAPSGGSQPYYPMPTLTYHETIPGHHLQIGLASELRLPLFRTIEVFLGFTEGWALYAERLAWEQGWYDEDPYGNLGRLSDEMMRAVRLVVDTGIHALGWTFDEAVDYFVVNTGRPASFAQAQIRRYIVWPGQSTSYMVGFLEILQLRDQVTQALGSAFALEDFHTLLLQNGSVPLGVLRQLVDRSIQL